MGKNISKSRASSSSSMFNCDVWTLEYQCPRICVVRKVNAIKNPGMPFYACPFTEVCLIMVKWCQKGLFNGNWFWFPFVQDDDDDDCEFFVSVEELGYFKKMELVMVMEKGKIDWEGSIHG